jgi:hypothetical protein
MDLALIPPNSMHTWMLDGGVNLMLPWQFSQLTEASVHSMMADRYTILDNGAAEGPAISWNQLAILADKWHVNEVVLPDKLGDAEFTIEVARQAGPLTAPLRERGIKIMAVVQGQTLAEVMKCVYAYAGWEHIDVIALPRILNKNFMSTSRVRLAESLAEDPLLSHQTIHCLGAYYPFPTEIKSLAQLPNVRSMDTSMPFVYGYAERFVRNGYPRNKTLERPGDYFNVIFNKRQKEVSSVNVNVCLDWAKAPRS